MNSKKLAIAALVNGIASIVLTPIGGMFLGIVALILGIVALRKMKCENNSDGRGIALAGAIIGGIMTLYLIVSIIFAIVAINMMMHSINASGFF